MATVIGMRTLVAVSSGLLLTAGLAAVAPAPSAGNDLIRGTSSSSQDRSAAQAAAAAGAAVVVGGTAGASTVACSADGLTLWQVATATGSPSYAVPEAGVLTSISHAANGQAGSIRAVFMGPGPALTQRTILGYTPLMPVTVDTLNSFPVRVPVVAGTFLAAFFTTSGMACAKVSAQAGDIYNGQPVAPTTGGTVTTGTGFTERLLNISAVWEPDVDGDGYGDVSQDSCPLSKLSQAPCPAPDTFVTKKPKKASSRRKVKIAFASETAAGYTCAVDGKPATPCHSPFKKKFSYGKHKIVITAISSVGIPDPTPATIKFKVTRPSR